MDEVLKKWLVKDELGEIMKSERLEFIDGIKALAAILVILSHITVILHPGFFANGDTLISRIWLETPLNALTNGNFAVQIFFVLTGFLITKNVFEMRECKLAFLGRRYLKLMRVVVPAILLPYFLMKMNLMYHIEALKINDGFSFVENYNVFEPTIKNMLYEMFYWVFVSGSRYNGPLWTIHCELFGSVLIVLLANYSSRSKGIWNYLFAAFLFCTEENMLAFILGAIVYEITYRESLRITLMIKGLLERKYIQGILWVMAIYFACINHTCTGMWSPLSWIIKMVDFDAIIMFRQLGVALMIFLILNNVKGKKLLSGKCLTEVGKLSPYIYSFHWPIILSVGCFTYVKLYQLFSYAFLSVIIYAVCIVSTIVIAMLYAYCMKKCEYCLKTKMRLVKSYLQRKILKIEGDD